MANICSCNMEIIGPPKTLQDIISLIKKQDSKLDKLFTWFRGEAYYGLIQNPEELYIANERIFIDFTCKWAPPEKGLMRLSKAYPDCTFKIIYEESGMVLYGTLVYKKGKKIEDVRLSEKEYLMEYDEEFNDMINIESMDYNSFKKKMYDDINSLEDDPSTCRFPHIIEEYYLKKLKDEDLPLLINYTWIDDANKDTFNERLKGKYILSS